jgi:hypothetical protein
MNVVVWVFQCQGVAVVEFPDDGSKQEPKYVGVIRMIIIN